MITSIKQFKELNETIFIPRNIEERKVKFRKENLRLLQQEILTVNTDSSWLELDETWRDINPKYVKCKQINGHVQLLFNENGCIPEWLENIIINGSFSCYNVGLTSLKGCPKIINGYFSCSWNDLTSLEYSPIVVGNNFYCTSNKLSSLKGCPKIIKGNFDCSNNDLTTLEYGPIEVGGDYMCYDNKITSLKGCPKIINGDFSCSYNQLTTLEYGPIEVGKNFYCYNNKTEFTEEYVKSVCTVKNEIMV